MGVLESCVKALERLYTDRFNLYRTVLKDDGYGGTIEEEVLISSDNICRLSKGTIKNGQISHINGSEQSYKLFIPGSIEVIQNDKLEIMRGNIKYVARASQPFKYVDLLEHQEIELNEVIENADNGSR